ncbi:histone-arginine methyltransferase, putative [Plasmodium gaboni]|uniref:Histone-arginine methyltransferase, putative n=1 Tax=Plasmodium gaboni TaxID=647221 RepID=A0ABY1UL11_9APIC|nr:histone-arginine methyltransferase, putative [Plasmodium gaboni]
MIVEKEELNDLNRTIEIIINNYDNGVINQRKEEFSNDDYAYSLCEDNYKSRKTRNVVINMLNKNINIIYYNDEYKNIIFINFLRLCQLNNLNVKKYHDLFIKYDAFNTIANSEKNVGFFLKPVIKNDKLLWDINLDDFDIYNLQGDSYNSTENVVYESNNIKNDNANNHINDKNDGNNYSYYILQSDIKVKLNDLLENSSSAQSSSYGDEESEYSLSSCSENEDNITKYNEQNLSSINNNIKHINNNINIIEKHYPNDLLSKCPYYINNKYVTNESANCEDYSIGDEEQKQKQKEKTNNHAHNHCPILNKNTKINHIPNKLEHHFYHFSNLNNININQLVDVIVNQDNQHKSCGDISKNYIGNKMEESILIEKFVQSSQSDYEEINNLHKKINSMEQIIKHLMNEIIKRDMNKKKKNENINVMKNDYSNNTNEHENNNLLCNKQNSINDTREKEIQTDKLEQINRNNTTRINEINFNVMKNVEHNIKTYTKEDIHEIDKKYFDSYNYADIHRTMILDKSRTQCYYDFINKNKEIFENKIVLDIGCGSSIISLFCSDYAKVVVGIDNAEKILEKAKKITEINKAKNIYLFKGKLEDHNIYMDEKNEIYYLNKDLDIETFEKSNNVKLDILKFDIIISEWMGYFLFYECMINTILYARDKYLKENGYIFPNKIYLYMSGYNDIEYINDNILIWDKPMYNKNLYELKPNNQEFMETAKIMYVDKNNVSSEIINYAIIDMYTYNKEYFYINVDFKIPLKENKIVTSLCFYFDCLFDKSTYYIKKNIHNNNNNNNNNNVNTNMGESINVKEQLNNLNTIPNVSNNTSTILTTSMFKEKTHWKQTLLHLYSNNYNLSHIFSTDNKEPNYLCGNIHISSPTNYTRHVHVVLQIKKNKSININEEFVCRYYID